MRSMPQNRHDDPGDRRDDCDHHDRHPPSVARTVAIVPSSVMHQFLGSSAVSLISDRVSY
jgi:hypothetical protein